MPVLPFHRYIGPGNPSENGPPIDEDDRIAKQHDHNYDRARSEEEVRAADLDAITRFRRNWLVDGNWHSLIGDIGLSFKYFIESYTGVIYPNLEEMVNENEECRIIVVNNFLKLHCVFKQKPLLEKYITNPFLDWEDRVKLPQLLKESSQCEHLASLVPPYILVPLNWPKIYIQSQSSLPLTDYKKTFNQHFLKNNTSSTDGVKIIAKCLEMIFFISRENIYRDNNKYDQTDILALIHSGYIYIDQDGVLNFFK